MLLSPESTTTLTSNTSLIICQRPKAFECLFGSVSCLPGCFSPYLRGSDKGRPIIISNRIIDLGEDHFLTTLLLKHFPTFKTKFILDAIAHTMALESWHVLFSQRRRWSNSTILNVCELAILPELCGFCCFSMSFFIFGVIVYWDLTLVDGPPPLIPGVQFLPTHLLFLVHGQFLLGNTRIVSGGGGNKNVVMTEDERTTRIAISVRWPLTQRSADVIYVVQQWSRFSAWLRLWTCGYGSAPGYQHSGSAYGGMPQDSRTMMMNMPMMTGGSQTGRFGMLPTMRRCTALVDVLDGGPTQDLMTVTKKTAREAIMAKFPKADLTSRKDFSNESINKILSQS
ncbi:chitin synthase-domain-containing protein [Suillus clintonianus]|uniref:chitin synthase-domain-containing protein n=1 Tax=Suillus clintonianus TaxID=1904413 RepID=UPI001B8633A2|nr:chitin synthase-domain-containing protein [Suillus clintonianus]KAG2156319.1 chitin synthase-domain-containing protein [Suillus clintonianus]